MQPAFAVLAAALLAVPLSAQLVTATAMTNAPMLLRAEHFGVEPLDQYVLPAVTNITSGVWWNVHSGGAFGLLAYQSTQVPAAGGEFFVSCQASAMSPPNAASLASDADLILMLHAFQPVRGALSVWVSTVPSGGVPAFGSAAVDVGADGTFEVVGNPYVPPFEVYAEFQQSFGPGALPIRILHAGSLDVPPMQAGNYRAHVIVRWCPGSGPVESYGTPCGLDLQMVRSVAGDFVFRLSPLPAGNAVLLFGATAMNVPIPLPPFCLQLCSFDTYLWWNSGDLIVPSVPLPAGFTMHAQAAMFESVASTPLSNGLRLYVTP
jgi:hypothetical protein